MAQYFKFLRPFHEAALVSESVGQWTKGAIGDLRAWRFALKDIQELNSLVLVPLLEKRQDSTSEARAFFLLHYVHRIRRR